MSSTLTVVPKARGRPRAKVANASVALEINAGGSGTGSSSSSSSSSDTTASFRHIDESIPDGECLFKLCTTKSKAFCQMVSIPGKASSAIIVIDGDGVTFQISIGSERGIILLHIPAHACDSYVYSSATAFRRGIVIANLKQCLSRLDPNSMICLYVTKKNPEQLVVVTDDRYRAISTTKVIFVDDDSELLEDKIAYDYRLEFDAAYFAREFGTQKRASTDVVTLSIEDGRLVYTTANTVKEFSGNTGGSEGLVMEALTDASEVSCSFNIDDLAKFNKNNKNEKRVYIMMAHATAIKVMYHFSNLGQTTLLLYQ